MTGPDPAAHSQWEPRSANTPVVIDVEHVFDGDGLYGLRAAVAAHASEMGVPDEKSPHPDQAGRHGRLEG